MDGRALFNPRFFERSQSALIRDLVRSQRGSNGHEVVLPSSSQLIPPFSFRCPSPSGLIPTARPRSELIFSRRCAANASARRNRWGCRRRGAAVARSCTQRGAIRRRDRVRCAHMIGQSRPPSAASADHARAIKSRAHSRGTAHATCSRCAAAISSLIGRLGGLRRAG